MNVIKTYLLLIPAVCWVLTSSAQNRTTLTKANADCSGIIDLLPADTVFGPTTAPVGPGDCDEIKGEKNSLSAFEKEHHTVWYRFRIPNDGLLTFDVIPLNKKDDYDFILYPFTGKNFCADVFNKKAKPVRTCISRNDPAQDSRTGLKQGAEDEFVHSGPGASYCKPLPVKKGEIFVLVLDNVYPSGKGHVLKLHYSKTSTARQNPVVKTPVKQKPSDKTKLVIKVLDSDSQLPVKANLEIIFKRNPGAPPVLSADSTDHAESLLSLNTNYFIKADASNYFGYIHDITTSMTPGTMNLTIELSRIMAGKKVVFDNILFYGDQARFLPESTPSLQTLANTMIKHPKLIIEIDGHVNWPKMMDGNSTTQMEAHNQQLSEERAKSVVDYLVSKGIAADRMTYKGYGSSHMLYPNARSEEQMKQNRRVEILIISNE